MKISIVVTGIIFGMIQFHAQKPVDSVIQI